MTDFLCRVLGWNAASVVVGERFDILLRDADGFPVATIETKTPYSPGEATTGRFAIVK